VSIKIRFRINWSQKSPISSGKRGVLRASLHLSFYKILTERTGQSHVLTYSIESQDRILKFLDHDFHIWEKKKRSAGYIERALVSSGTAESSCCNGAQRPRAKKREQVTCLKARALFRDKAIQII